MSDRISVMRNGRIVQSGSPRELYDAPVNRYVADFVGESNFFAGEVLERAPDRARIRTAGELLLSAPYSQLGGERNGAESWVIAVRPEVIGIWPVGAVPTDCDVSLSGRITNRIYLGDQTEFNIETDKLGGILVRAAKTSEAVNLGLKPGDQVTIGWSEDAGLALPDV